MFLTLSILVSVVVLATCAISAGLLLDSLSRYDRAYRIGPIRYRKAIVDGESTYCFQICPTYRKPAIGTTIATTK